MDRYNQRDLLHVLKRLVDAHCLGADKERSGRLYAIKAWFSLGAYGSSHMVYYWQGGWYVNLETRIMSLTHFHPEAQMEWYKFNIDHSKLASTSGKFLRFKKIEETLEYRYKRADDFTSSIDKGLSTEMVAYTPTADSCFVTGDVKLDQRGYRIEIKPEFIGGMQQFEVDDISTLSHTISTS